MCVSIYSQTFWVDKKKKLFGHLQKFELKLTEKKQNFGALKSPTNFLKEKKIIDTGMNVIEKKRNA